MTKTLNISDEDKALLTAEELAGMEEGEEFDEEGEDEVEGTAAKEEGKTGDEATANADEAAANADETGAEAEAAAAAKPDDTGAAASAADTGNDDAAAAELAFATVPPIPVSKLPDDYEDKVKSVATDKKALAEQLDEGDITMAEYHEKLDGLNRTERELERTKDRVSDNEGRRYETWTNIHVIGFMKMHSEYSTNEMLTGLLDQEVRKLQAAGTYTSDTDPKILVDAHKKIAASFPAAFSAVVAPVAKKKEAAAPVVHKTVPSLAKVPAANVDQPGEGEFSSLDRLLETDTLAWERACERLSKSDPAKYEQYLAQ